MSKKNSGRRINTREIEKTPLLAPETWKASRPPNVPCSKRTMMSAPNMKRHLRVESQQLWEKFIEYIHAGVLRGDPGKAGPYSLVAFNLWVD